MAEKKRQPPPPQKGPRTTPQPAAANGHRFGPSLTCTFCGVSYGAHHREPRPCPHDPATPAAGAVAPLTPS